MPMMIAVKRLAVATVLAHVFLTPFSVMAQETTSKEHLAAATDTVIAVGASRQMELVMPIMINQMERTYVQLKPKLTDQISAALETLRPKFTTRMNTFIDKMAIAYADKFTIDELKSITAFYSSQAGKKFVAGERDLERSNARTGREFSEQLGREIDSELRAEMKKRGHDF